MWAIAHLIFRIFDIAQALRDLQVLNIPAKREEGRRSRPSSLFAGMLFLLCVTTQVQ
jgi:hypothetical protein